MSALSWNRRHKKFPKDLSVEDILIRSSNVGTVKIARQVGKEKFINFINKTDLMNRPSIQVSELGQPLSFDWEKCRLKQSLSATELQQPHFSCYYVASIANGGLIVEPTLIKMKLRHWSDRLLVKPQVINYKKYWESCDRWKWTASLADIHGYSVSGKTGTSQSYNNKKTSTHLFHFLILMKKKYTLLVLLEDPKIAKNLIYNYRSKNQSF